jgi:glycosyltransferase involved in cell wall biosynthesis
MQDNNQEFWKQLKEFPGLGRKLKIGVFLPNQGGCAYYRVILPYRKLEELYGNVIEISWSENPLGWKQGPPLEENIDRQFFESNDIIITNNIPNYGGNYLARVLGITREHNKIFHFDTDDLLTELYPGHRLERVYKEGLSDLTKWVYNNSDIVTVTQNKFAERISQFLGARTTLAVIRNSIDYNLPAWNSNRTKAPFVRVGWAGGIHHEEDVKEVAGVPWLVNQKVGKENVRWDFYGKPPIQDEKDKWQLDVWSNYERVLANGFKGYKNYTINSALPADRYGVMYANMDIAIAPLQMNVFNDSKSDIKVAECGRYKVPLICSDVGCYNETIENGKTGYLIKPGRDSMIRWISTLSKAIKDKDKITEMGEQLHQITQEVFDINKVVHQRLNFMQHYLQSVGKINVKV